MSTVTAKDGTTIYYKDWGQGPVVTFSHGWPLSSDAWDGQMLFLANIKDITMAGHSTGGGEVTRYIGRRLGHCEGDAARSAGQLQNAPRVDARDQASEEAGVVIALTHRRRTP